MTASLRCPSFRDDGNGGHYMGEMGSLYSSQPTCERCNVHGRTKCQRRVRYWWERTGKRAVGYCAEHAADTFPQAFVTMEGAS